MNTYKGNLHMTVYRMKRKRTGHYHVRLSRVSEADGLA